MPLPIPQAAVFTLLLCFMASGCRPADVLEANERPHAPASAVSTVEPESTPELTPKPSVEAPTPQPTPAREEITLIAGGDVSFGRALGQLLLKNPAHNPFTTVSELMSTADVRFVNLESQLSDQKGETESKTQKLVFTGPPAGADALKQGNITLVSLANNHAWDYGRNALFETFANLERVGVAYVGAGRTRKEAYAPAILDIQGFRLAVLAVTDIWNQGPLSQHPGQDHVAGSNESLLVIAVREAAANPTIDAVIVSHHGGGEYIDPPLPRTRMLAQAVIDAGADAFIGHHPHVIQGVEIRKGRPILYSLGNFLFRMASSQPATELGMLTRLRLSKKAAPTLELCPFRTFGLEPIPLKGDEQKEATELLFTQRFRKVQSFIKDAPKLGAFQEDGCATVMGK